MGTSDEQSSIVFNDDKYAASQTTFGIAEYELQYHKNDFHNIQDNINVQDENLAYL